MQDEEPKSGRQGALDGAPDTPTPEGSHLERCDDDRGGLTPKETADCAGVDLVERYENEEDGGS